MAKQAKRSFFRKQGEAAASLVIHKPKSSDNAQNLESTFDNNAQKSKKVDSRGFRLVSSPLWDSRICDDKAGLRRLLRGDKTDCLSHKQKASSLLYRAKQAKQSFFRKPNPCQKSGF